MHTWIIDFTIVINGTNVQPKLLGQNIGLGAVQCERIEKSESIHSFIHLFIRCAYWICGCVNVWAFINKARCEAFGCNYKLFFTRYALHIAFHSFVPTDFLFSLCITIFSIIECNRIGMQFAIHVACCVLVVWDVVCLLACIVSRFWALVSHSMHLCECECVSKYVFMVVTLIHTAKDTHYFLCWKITFHDIACCCCMLCHQWQQWSFTVGFWYLMLKYSVHLRVSPSFHSLF